MKFYTSMTKGLKLNVKKFGGLNRTFVEVTGEKLVERGGGLFGPTPILNRVVFPDKSMNMIVNHI